jgi:hypothetical protein
MDEVTENEVVNETGNIENNVKIEKPKKKGLSTAGFVLGIIAVALCWIPVVNNVSFVLGTLAVIFGVIGIVKKHGTFAIVALVLGAISLAATIGMQHSISTKIKDSTTNVKGEAESIFASSEGLRLDGDPQLEPIGTGAIASIESFQHVTGTILNDSDKTFKSPSIKFHAYDADGKALDACSDYGSMTLAPHEKWDFKASCGYGDKVAKIQLDEISHF